jgi:hypothetical protein
MTLSTPFELNLGDVSALFAGLAVLGAAAHHLILASTAREPDPPLPWVIKMPDLDLHLDLHLSVTAIVGLEPPTLFISGVHLKWDDCRVETAALLVDHGVPRSQLPSVIVYHWGIDNYKPGSVMDALRSVDESLVAFLKAAGGGYPRTFKSLRKMLATRLETWDKSNHVDEYRPTRR